MQVETENLSVAHCEFSALTNSPPHSGAAPRG
jgi:hypothetical protein